MSLVNALNRSFHQLSVKAAASQGLLSSSSSCTTQQIRTKITNTKKRRLLKKQKAEQTTFVKPPPANHIPKEKSVIINPTASRTSLAQKPEHERLSNLLSSRSSQLSQEAPPLRYNFTNLSKEMSPKLRKLFDLTNGSSSELAKAQKSRAMQLFESRPGDTGSSAVQIMALTSRIQQMQKHVATHRKDYSGKRGLDAMYVKRRKMLDYLERKDYDTYNTVVKALGLVR